MRRRTHHPVVLATAIIVSCALHTSPGIALPSIPAQSFQSATTCICHGPQQDEWRGSMHAKALFDPVYVAEKTEADKATGGALGAFCDTCHTPIGTMSGQTKTRKFSPQSREGVTCDFCHQVVGTTKTPPGDASQKLVADGTKRAQLWDATSPTHANAFSQFHRSAEFCGACHNLAHPTTGVILDDTYTQWKAGPYAAEGIVCQNCHMTPGPGERPLTGRAGAMGPIRDDTYLMTFSGANVALGDPERARIMLTRAASISLTVPEVVPAGDQGSVKVRVTNYGAGHAIPAGVAEIREMWLEVNAIQPDGSKRLLGTRRFGTVFRDAQGRYPVQVWDAVAVQSDDRIPPRGSVDVEYALPMDSETSVTVEAVLNYRSFPDDLARKAGVENPITVMARGESTVFASTSIQDEASRSSRGRSSAALDRIALFAGAGIALLVVIGVSAIFVRRHRVRRPD